MKTVQTTGVLLLLFLCLPLGVSAQAPSSEELRERALRAGISQERLNDLDERAQMRSIGDQELAVILQPAVELAEQNLPSEMIFRKAMEGIAKGVQPAMMEQVLAQIRTGTEQARPMVDQWLDRPEVQRMTERSGEQMDRERFREEMLRVSSRAVSGETGLELVSQILEAMSDEGVLMHATPAGVLTAVNIAADLPSAGEQPGRTGEIISKAMQSGFSSGDLQRLPAAMNTAQRRSQLPASAVMEGVTNQLDRGVPAADILQNLFDGDVRGGGPPGNVPPGLENRPGRGDDHPGGGGRPVPPGQGGGSGDGPGQGGPGSGSGDGPGQGSGRN